MLEIRQIPAENEAEIKLCASLISEHSWGADYPVDPAQEMLTAYVWGAYVHGKLAGCAALNPLASPDGIDNGEWWFADAVVLPEYRNQGIYTKLYAVRVKWMLGRSGRKLSCTDNPIMDKFFIEHGWHKIRDTPAGQF